LPVLTALRHHLPEARIGWAVEAPFAPLLEGFRDAGILDSIFPVRFKKWRSPWRSRAVRRQMRLSLGEIRRFRAEVALDLMGNHKAGFLARVSGARRRIGLGRRWRREPSSALWINEPVAARGDHAVERALSVLEALSLPREAPDFGSDFLLPESPETQRQLERWAAPAAPAPRLLLCPGAGWGNKEYPPRWWGQVAAGLAREVGAVTWIPSGPGEEALGEAVAAHSEGAARHLGMVDLSTLAALMRRSRLVLAGDTGPLHLAHALGAPVLAVMGPTDPQRHGPFGDPQGALARELPCSYCYKRLPEPKGCLLEIPPRQVIQRAVERLEAAPQSPPH
jgi:heptosyltransferase-1